MKNVIHCKVCQVPLNPVIEEGTTYLMSTVQYKCTNCSKYELIIMNEQL